jgi:hypothetical protein
MVTHIAMEMHRLMRYAAALGGRLELRVVFPDQVVDLTPAEAKPKAKKKVK